MWLPHSLLFQRHHCSWVCDSFLDRWEDLSGRPVGVGDALRSLRFEGEGDEGGRRQQTGFIWTVPSEPHHDPSTLPWLMLILFTEPGGHPSGPGFRWATLLIAFTQCPGFFTSMTTNSDREKR